MPTNLILLRLGHAMIPFSNRFITGYRKKPDLYGPFWVLTTLVATLFISSNIYCFLTFTTDNKQALAVSIKLIPIAATVIYGVAIGLPLLLKLIVNLYGTAPILGQEAHTTVF